MAKKITLIIFIILIFLIFQWNNLSETIQKQIYPKKYEQYVDKYSQECDVDNLLIYSIIKVESNFNEKANSHAEAIGLMQLMENTAVETYGHIEAQTVNVEELYQPEINIKIGTYYFSTLLTQYNSVGLALAAYNAGMGRVDKWIKEGTIKLLLIKPYTRNQILLSKYLSMIIVMVLSIIYLYLTQLLIGGFYLGFSSLQEKVVIYNFQLSTIMCYNIFGYTFLRVLLKLPMLILLSTLSFLISIITSNNILSLTISLIVYIFSASIKSLAINYNIKIMKYLLTMNWNINEYLFGKLSEYKYLNLTTSIIICIIYYIFLLILSFMIFNKKDIKNI